MTAGGIGGRARLVMIVNPTASSVSPGRLASVRAALAAGHAIEVAETTGRGHATELARQAAGAGADVVVVLGGDGTQNEAANGLVGTNTALAVVPGGSTNVFARTIGMSDDPTRSCGQLLDSISRRSIRRIGLGAVNGRYFLFHVGMGYDAAVVAQVEKWMRLKALLGQAVFVLAGVATWALHFDRGRPMLTVEADRPPEAAASAPREAFMVVCLNASPYTYLGRRPLDIAPDASLDNGLAVVSLHTLSFLPMLSILASAIGVGRPVGSHADVSCSYDHQRVTVRGRAAFPYQVDGDYLGNAEELVMVHEPECLDLVVP